MRLYRHGRQLFEIFMQPNLTPVSQYLLQITADMINATQGIQSTLWAHSGHTLGTLSKHLENI